MRAFLLGALCLTAVWCTTAPAAPVTNTLDALQAAYEKALLDIEDSHAGRCRAWPAAYTNALRALQGRLQKAGDLDGWVAAKAELERFTADPLIAPDAVVRQPATLQKLQLDYQKARQAYDLDRATRIRDLSDKYLRRLESLKKQSTVDGQMESALAAKQEIERVQSSPEVAAAAFLLAENAAGQALSRPAPMPAPESPAPPARPAAPPPPPELTGADAPRIYYGQPPPPPQGVTFQRLQLQRTPNGSLTRMVNVEASKGTRVTSVDQNRDSGLYFSYEVNEAQSESLIRLGLRSPKASDVIADATVLVQYFSTDTEKSTGKLDSAPLTAQKARVQRIDAKTVYVDFPPVSLSRYTSSVRAGSYSRTRREGQRLHGVIISVFDAEGVVCFQGASAGSLVKQAPTAIPADL
jgi:hypothetical protein